MQGPCRDAQWRGWRALVPAAALALVTGAGAAQVAAGWECVAARCTETSRVFATHEGTFRAAAGLSLEDDADRVAALEQQSQREFEYVSAVPSVVSARLRAPAEDLEVHMWSSPDGETYTPLSEGAALAAGDMVLIAVRQARSAADGTVTYRPARFALELSYRRVMPEDAVATALPDDPPLLLSADGDPEQEDPGQPAPEVPEVAGTARPDPAAAAEAPATSDDGLAVELQRELARLGCYVAVVDGLWGPASRRAMQDFNRATGDALPVETPSARALVRVSQTEAPVCTE